MSCVAISPFKGDASHLLDRLVEACNQPAAAAAARPLAERELVAFNWEDWELPKPVPSAGKKERPAPKKAAAAVPGSSPSSNKRAVSPASGSSGAKSPPRKHAAAAAHCTPPPAQARAAATETGCPGFFTSPKPEALPMPTTLLMSRAAVCVKA